MGYQHHIASPCNSAKSSGICACSTGVNHEKTFQPLKIILYFCGILLFMAGIILPLEGLFRFTVFAAAYIIFGNDILLRAAQNITRGKVFDENFLMSIATLGAFTIGEYPEGVAVMIFFQTGEMLQGYAVNRSRRSIKELMDIRPDYAHLKEGDETRKVSPEEVKTGSIIMVRPGERVPLDGTVLEGSSTLDLSALTGESLPDEVKPGDEILSGSINKTGLISIRVTREFSQSTVSNILSLVEDAASRKAHTEKFITRFAGCYTPVVVAAAFLLAFLPPVLIPGQALSTWVYRALVFLVISCPCALVISIPLGFFGGIGGASRRGILVKGGNFLEGLSHVGTVIFDKTGTLTRGAFTVKSIHPSAGFQERELLNYGAAVASHSSHPVSTSILQAWEGIINEQDVSGFNELPGQGVRVNYQGKEILMGNAKMIKQHGIPFPEERDTDMGVHITVEGKYAGSIAIADEVRDDSATAITKLRNLGVNKIVMLTGDKKTVADNISKKLGLDQAFSQLLPHQKVEKIEELEKQNETRKKIVFVGDGINDAPSLARAEIGVAMGGIASDAAIEAADIVLMTGQPSKLSEAITIARKTKSIIMQNVVFALGVKAAVLLLGAMGLASMWGAVFADVGVALLAVLNSMRAMR
ncbi:MAG: cadmium-translocating P-type ATPase [Candidatus Syntrophonatronum acetioxidans]|uniref:Cd(2+)-exporting ATPase n=1 Tax=Candidatus Syntrophonatronum acetioxidans TaxID=1795816 RepID=A0A424YC40_9FIRM|nr:MAG: cadmium-translocating P-type ATPase [Candidatus Syntrophonatronum acetioxidans]